jgi:hypothetical protein
VGQTFNLSGVQMVRYGDGITWRYKQDSGSGQCTNAYLGYWSNSPKLLECQAFTPAVATNPTAMPGSAPAIDLSKIPLSNPGFTTDRVRSTTEIAPLGGDGTGSFRSVCEFSHMKSDDSLVNPNQPGASHLHTFFGNTGADAYSTATSIATTGASTCRGGTINRSAYWVPTLIDTSNGTPLAAVATFYYKTGYNGISPSEISPLPEGLRMITGNPKANSNENSSANGNWSCENVPSGIQAPPSSKSIPNCPVGSEIRMNLSFPQCWDGINLDSPDHRSHMSYTVSGRCPTTHPVAISEISFHIVYPVKVANAPLLWRLSSDNYAGDLPGGLSNHGDWMNGWKSEFMNAFVKGCNQAARDCKSHLLGDGRTFYGYQ